MTPKQQQFVREYLIDLNGTQAAIRAGFSARTANEQAVRLLANVSVKASIDAAIAARSAETQIDAAWVLKRLHAEAEADVNDLYDDNDVLLPVSEWPLIFRQGLVQGIEVEELFEGRGADRIKVGEVRKVRFDSRIRRVELIGKHVRVNAFQDTVKHEGLDGLAERIARAAARNG